MHCIDEFKVKQISENLMLEIQTLVRKAFKEGYDSGYNHSRQLLIENIVFYDLGLQSGTLWSAPVTIKHQYSYVTYDLKSYDSVRELGLPSVEDFEELLENCSVATVENIVSKDVEIIGPGGARLSIGTKDYLNNESNPNSILCRRQGEQVEPMTNQFWLRSDCENNKAKTCLVDFDKKSISISSHFTGFKLPYMLVKKPQ